MLAPVLMASLAGTALAWQWAEKVKESCRLTKVKFADCPPRSRAFGKLCRCGLHYFVPCTKQTASHAGASPELAVDSKGGSKVGVFVSPQREEVEPSRCRVDLTGAHGPDTIFARASPTNDLRCSAGKDIAFLETSAIICSFDAPGSRKWETFDWQKLESQNVTKAFIAGGLTEDNAAGCHSCFFHPYAGCIQWGHETNGKRSRKAETIS